MKRLVSLALLLAAPTLQAGDGRFELAQVDMPITIVQPGSYVLTENITGLAGVSGITIAGSGVTMDLNGFSLTGDETSLHGIEVLPGTSGITIRNGALHYWGGAGVEGIAATAVNLENLEVTATGWAMAQPGLAVGPNSRVRDCRVTGSGQDGISCVGNVLVTGCQVSECNGTGINNQSGRVVDCVAVGNAQDGIFGRMVHGCYAEVNGLSGILAGDQALLSDCHASYNALAGLLAGNDSVIRQCISTGNGADGIALTTGGVVQNCASGLNLGHGMLTGTGSKIGHSTVRENTLNGIVCGDGTSVEHTSVISNSQTGIVAGAVCRLEHNQVAANALRGIHTTTLTTIQDCQVASSQGDGIAVGSHCTVRDNVLVNNGTLTGDGANLYATGDGNLIEDNVLKGADRGLHITGTNNRVSGNTVALNTDNYVIAQGNQLNLRLSEIPESIDWPAVVVLTGTLTGKVDQVGLSLAANDITIDLAGHALVGVPGSEEGVKATTSLTNLVIRNGGVSNWGANGMDISFARSTQLIGLIVRSNLYTGCRAGDETLLKECKARGNGGTGFHVGNACQVIRCTAVENGSSGITGFAANTVSKCVSRDNFYQGIDFSSNSSIRDCVAADNGAQGIKVLHTSQVLECLVRDNQYIGIKAGIDAIVRDCVLSNNKEAGIYVAGNCLVEGNTLTGLNTTAADGIRMYSDCVIRDNTITQYATGIVCWDDRNLIYANRLFAVATNFNLVAGNKVGSIQTIPSSGAITGSVGAVGFGTTDPFVNLVY